MFVKQIVLIVAILTSMTFFGCSKNNNDNDTESETDTDSETDSDTEKTAECEGDHVFADPNLDAIVRRAIGFQVYGDPNRSYTDEFTKDILAELGFLQAVDSKIQDLTGLECLKNITTLNISINNIKDISPIAGCTKLTELWSVQNKITDISPLTGLTNLSRLWMSQNQISDISPLSNMKKIEYLIADDNLIKDVSPAVELSTLTALHLSRNPLSNVELIGKMSNLTSLEVNGCGISSIKWISGLSSLKKFSGATNEIKDISALAGLKNLYYLDMASNKIEDPSPLAKVPSLEHLYIEGNQISDLSFLSAFKTFSTLLIADNKIEDLSPIESVDWYKGGRFCRAEFIGDVLMCLIDFDFHGNQIEDLSTVKYLLEIFEGHEPSIDISSNKVEDLSPLAGFALSKLEASDNLIRDAGSLLGFNIGEINLTDNRIESLSFVPMIKQSSDHLTAFVLGNPLDETALLEEAPRACDLFAELYYGDGKWCDWIDNPKPLPDWNENPKPDTTPRTQPESCGVDRVWLADGDLPEVAHNGLDFTVSEPAAGEPIVTDEVTGLTWRRCSAGQTWDGAACSGLVTALEQSAATTECASTYAGFDDWRVPDVTELVSVVDYSTSWPGPVIDATAFPETYPGMYWASPVLPTGSPAAWQVNFYNGALLPSRDNAAVRCVRGGGTGDVNTRYTVEASGISVTDTWTDLSWQRCASGQTWDKVGCAGDAARMNKAASDQACDDAYDGFSDWRLPTVTELSSIINYCAHDASISFAAFPNAPRNVFWTSTPLSGDTKTWLLDFGYGELRFKETSSSQARVRCVRNK